MAKETHTKYAILGLLTTGCHTGYSIKQMIDGSLNHFWKISYGQIYPTLKNLVDEGLATVKDTTQDGKPDKKEYHLTQDGHRALQSWLQLPINGIPTEKNELLLKLFFSRHQNKDITINHIDQYLEKLQERYNTYDSIEQMIIENLLDKADAQFWLMTLDYGKRTTQAAIEWCKDTTKKLSE
ncbi:PadR family transcriptional regulator [Alkalihalobacillus sp. AL-G]|uniref:PadR family transcriptional regulator n=1 Tax=Alkalihalobacillus sp. AL-G TaxID=2926399 RepID=UPI00272D811A|nr:PadR family transcriptional regulator [Alkalihalobacillus sp. AL-G]WLD92834.1 PadR family transcriptional regulator [Alkalihalobacillus sp. AL-G]